MATFNSAFASARKAGKKTFVWNGKKYTTEVRSDQAPAKSKRPAPRENKPSAMTTAPTRGPAPKASGPLTKPKDDPKMSAKAERVRKKQLGSAGGQKSRKR